MSVKVRFAPSPTGKLHVGNVRTALVNWMFAKGQGGSFVLRIDDTDLARSTPEFEQGIEDDLTWLGLLWDERYNQSKRFDRYDDAAERLKAAGRLYPAYETVGRAGSPPQGAAVARPAADLRPRGAGADGRGKGRVRGRGPQAALALQAGRASRRLGGPVARSCRGGHGIDVGPGADPRGRAVISTPCRRSSTTSTWASPTSSGARTT